MLIQRLLTAIFSAAALTGANGALAAAAIAQEENPCDHTAVVAASETTRRLTLTQFGIALEIPENFRAMLRSDGSVEVMDPGTYRLFRCQAMGGPPPPGATTPCTSGRKRCPRRRLPGRR